MKKLFLFVLLSTLSISLNSCSGDDDAAPVNEAPQIGGTVSFKVNGTQKTFNNILVNEEPQSNGDTWLTVTASQDGNPTESIIFAGAEGQIGSIAISQWGYQNNGITYNQGGMNNDIYIISSIVQVNSNGVLKGSFTGSLTTTDGTQNVIEITDGTFDIVY